jgi:hypothetical protein
VGSKFRFLTLAENRQILHVTAVEEERWKTDLSLLIRWLLLGLWYLIEDRKSCWILIYLIKAPSPHK